MRRRMQRLVLAAGALGVVSLVGPQAAQACTYVHQACVDQFFECLDLGRYTYEQCGNASNICADLMCKQEPT